MRFATFRIQLGSGVEPEPRTPVTSALSAHVTSCLEPKPRDPVMALNDRLDRGEIEFVDYLFELEKLHQQENQ